MKKSLLCLTLALALLCGACLTARADESVNIVTLDSFAKVVFSGAFEEYSGPGTNYVRGKNGEARYKVGVARLYGKVDDWLLIGYQSGTDEYRIGYISAAALNGAQYREGTLRELNFSPVLIGYAGSNCKLCEDTVYHATDKAVYTVPAGTAFTVLAYKPEADPGWYYIEVNTNAGLRRGFVRPQQVEFRDGKVPATPIPTPAPTARPTAAPTQAPYVYPTVVPTPAYVYPTQVPYNVPTRAPYIPPTQAPYAAPTAAPVSGENTYYHDQVKGTWFPETQYVRVTGSWPVYSGPGTYYWRAANGQAAVANSSVILYGVENGWALIGYGLSGGGFRVGYISASALPKSGLRVPYLDLVYQSRRVTAACSLTDDISRSYGALFTVPANTYVLFLGYVTDANNTTWAFVEMLHNNEVYRGFIPAANLAR